MKEYLRLASLILVGCAAHLAWAIDPPAPEFFVRCVDQETRSRIIERRQAQPGPHQQLIAENLELTFTTTDQNLAWMRAAGNARPGTNWRWFISENAELRNLNNSTGSMNFVTAMTNRHISMLKQRVDALMDRNPSVTFVMKASEKGLAVGHDGGARIEAEINRIFEEVNPAYARDLQARGTLRTGDRPANWFRAGSADTPDKANAYARAGHRREGENRVITAVTPGIHDALVKSVIGAERVREVLDLNWRYSPLMEGEVGRLVPTAEMMDFIRKAKTDSALVGAVRKRYPELSRFDIDDARRFRLYDGHLDRTAPDVWSSERNIANLDGAQFGGASGDFRGWGPENRTVHAHALAGITKLDAALAAARMAEREFTNVLRRRLDTLMSTLGYSGRRTGDNVYGAFFRPLTLTEKAILLRAIAAEPQTRNIRVAFIPEGVEPPSSRSTLADHGERIEKELRSVLTGHLPAKVLDGLVFGIDMRTKTVGTGPVNFLIATQPGLILTAGELGIIRAKFGTALDRANIVLRNQSGRAMYRPAVAP